MTGGIMKRAIITIGLGFGDEGKGATIDYLAREYGADLVVRYCGGSQAGHNVQLPDGRRHTFSQFGAGTLAEGPGRPKTYLGPNVVIDPPAILREAQHLSELGVDHPRELDLWGLSTEAVARRLSETAQKGPAVSSTIPECHTAIFEGAQGVLLDEYRGFHPHTTWSTVTTHHAWELIRQLEVEA